MRYTRIFRSDFSYYETQELRESLTSGSLSWSEGFGDFAGIERGAELEKLREFVEHRVLPTRRAIVAVDVTIAAPKAVSVRWGLEDAGGATTYLELHRSAVRSVVDYINATGLMVRTAGGEAPGRHLNAIGFEHYLSRANDPHLHTHLVVVNAVELENAVDRAVDFSLLERIGPVLELLYRSELRHSLADRGEDLSGPPLGTLVMRGMRQGLVDEFSQRRREVSSAALPFGSSGRARELAALRTRSPKGSVDLSELRTSWAERSLQYQDRPIERPRSPLYELGVEMMRSGGIYVAPVANPLHAEVAYRMVTEPYRELSELIRVATASLARSQNMTSPDVTDRVIDRYPRNPRTWERVLGHDADHDRAGKGFGPRHLLGRTSKENDLYRALGLASDRPVAFGGRGVLEMVTFERVPPSHAAGLKRSGRLGAFEKVQDPIEHFRRQWRDSLLEASPLSIAVELDDGKRLKIHREPIYVLSEAKRALRTHLEQNLSAIDQGAPVDLHSCFSYEHREIGGMVVNQLREGDRFPSVQHGRGTYLAGEIVTGSKARLSERFVLLPTREGGDDGFSLYAVGDGDVVDRHRPISISAVGFLRSVSHTHDPLLGQMLGEERHARPIVSLFEADHHILAIPRRALGERESVDSFDRVARYLNGATLNQEIVHQVDHDLKVAWRLHLDQSSRSDRPALERLSDLRQHAVLVREIRSFYARSGEWERLLEREVVRELGERDDHSLGLRRAREGITMGWDR